MHTNSWKNKKVFEKQLEINKKNLCSYPPHWNSFIKIVHNILNKNKDINILDIGCGCGAFLKLCENNFKESVKYTGIDYSEDAIELAKKEWNSDKFMCKDIFDLDNKFITKFNVLHLGAVLDVLPNADQALSFILSFGIPYIIITRIDIVNGDSVLKTYSAYDEIITYKHDHGNEIFEKILADNNYIIEFKENNNILLKKI
jgi:SAM-dependent methyltransferase